MIDIKAVLKKISDNDLTNGFVIPITDEIRSSAEEQDMPVDYRPIISEFFKKNQIVTSVKRDNGMSSGAYQFEFEDSSDNKGVTHYIHAKDWESQLTFRWSVDDDVITIVPDYYYRNKLDVWHSINFSDRSTSVKIGNNLTDSFNLGIKSLIVDEDLCAFYNKIVFLFDENVGRAIGESSIDECYKIVADNLGEEMTSVKVTFMAGRRPNNTYGDTSKLEHWLILTGGKVTSFLLESQVLINNRMEKQTMYVKSMPGSYVVDGIEFCSKWERSIATPEGGKIKYSFNSEFQEKLPQPSVDITGGLETLASANSVHSYDAVKDYLNAVMGCVAAAYDVNPNGLRKNNKI